MSATKILWGQITVVFLIILITTWGATQYVAWSLGFQAQLGTPWFELSGVPIYYPPAIFWWWYFYDAYAPEIFAKAAETLGAAPHRMDANVNRPSPIAYTRRRPTASAKRPRS